MKEKSNGIEHPPLNFAMRPDLGGTTFNFIKEVTRDRTTYIISNEFSRVFLTIPGHKDFLHVSVENLGGGRFIEAHYDHWGALTSANIWFRRYCEQNDFVEKTNPNNEVIDAHDQLTDSKTDIMFEADISQHNYGIYFCTEDSRSDNIEAISAIDCEITADIHFIKFHTDEDDEINPVTFCASVEDNILFIGFQPNKNTVVRESISTLVNTERLYGKATPADVQAFLDGVFVYCD